MFNNPHTLWIEILVLTVVALFLLTLLARYIYKKKHHLPTGDCAYCHKDKKELLKEYHNYCNCHKK